MSETLQASTEPRSERILIRTCGIITALAWPATLGIIIARAGHALPLATNTFAVLTLWSLALACLSLGLCVFCGSDPGTVAALAHLDFGNPALDEALRPGTRPHWRARRPVRTAFTATSSACWLTSALYSIQIALGVYRTGPVTELFLLGWLLGLALWSTVIAAAAPAEHRRAHAFTLAREMHRAQRESREQAARRAAESGIGATGELPRPLMLVSDDEPEHRGRSTGTRFGASG